jgi:hypothetical protein
MTLRCFAKVTVATVAVTALIAGCISTSDRPPAMGKFAEAALANRGFDWDSVRTDRLTLYMIRGSYAAARASQFRVEAEDALDRALTLLGERSYPSHLQVFALRSREDVESITGAGWNGWSDPAGHNAAVVARPECRPILFKHEIMHTVSLSLWGNPLGPDKDPFPPKDSARMEQGHWLREGIAAAAQDLYVTYSYRGMAAQWLAEGTLLPLDTLVHGFSRVDDLTAYIQSGSLVAYLLERYGREPFRVIWRDGASAFERAYGKTSSQLEAEWQGWLEATPPSVRPKSITVARSEDQCPRRRR